MIVDWQHHFCPPEILQMRGGKRPAPGSPIYNEKGQVMSHFQPDLYDIDGHLHFMDAAGIDVAVLSMPACRSVEESRVVNGAFGRIMKDHPDRFWCLAACLPTKGKEALDELERSIREIGLRGVSIDFQTDGHNLDSEALWPFYEMVEKSRVPIFVHIAGTRQGFEGLFSEKFNLWTTLGTMVIDQSAVVRIILGGVLARFSGLTFVISHLGGGISAIRERFVRYLDAWGSGIWTELGGNPPFGEPFGRNFDACFDRLYFDMAGYEGGMNAVRCALTTISPDRLLFGTDYPFNFTGNPSGVRSYIEDIRRLDLSEGAIEGMLGENAARLFGL